MTTATAIAAPPPQNHRQLLTSSRMRSFRDCQRMHHLRFVQGWRPVQTSTAMHFGTLIHLGLEAWWGTVSDQDTPGAALHEALAVVAGRASDPYEQARVEELLSGYDRRWRHHAQEFDVIAVESSFEAPLLNPSTWRPSMTWMLAGKIDLLVRERATGRVIVVEHKTTTENVAGDDSTYWAKLAMDHQISAYVVGAEALGHTVDEVLYDVLRRPGQEVLRATPAENRKYKKDGTLYAYQRERDETPEEHRARVREAIEADPYRYFQQRRIPRMESQIEDFMFDAWQQGAAMRESARLGRAPRNPDACHRFGTCGYWDLCSSGGKPEDFPGTYVLSEKVNPELEV